MKKSLLTLMVSAGFLTSCATYLPAGALYTGVKTGVSANNSVASSKTGKACSTSVLGLVAVGDSSLESAKKAGNITNVATVDYSVENILGIYGSYCTEVSGN